MRISVFIIALIVIGLVGATFGMMVSDLNEKHPQSDYNQSNMEVYNKLEEMNDLTDDMQDKVQNQTTKTGITDIVGSFIGDVVDALRLASTSYDMFETMGEEGVKQAGLPRIFTVALLTIVLVLVVFAIISAMLKKDV